MKNKILINNMLSNLPPAGGIRGGLSSPLGGTGGGLLC